MIQFLAISYKLTANSFYYMKKFGLIGYPLTHSFSQNYFTEKFLKENKNDCSYENFSIENIAELLDIIKQNPDLIGLNVTIPYKEKVMEFLSETDEIAKEIGAVNTIKIKADGTLKGFNTDAWGFAKSLSSVLSPRFKQALILGTGGASKAIIYVLRRIGINCIIISRNPESGQFDYSQIDKSLIMESKLIVNCTPLGTFPDINSYPLIPYQFIGSEHLLYDVVYNPEETVFLTKGKEQGATIKNGKEMLITQAEESWRIWNDQKS
jgi:shikimate dehydrogenase